MSFKIIKNDDAKTYANVLIRVCESSDLGDFSKDQSLLKVAGDWLLADCKKFGFCPSGEAYVTNGYSSDYDRIVHMVSPSLDIKNEASKEYFISCYEKALLTALQLKYGSIAIAVPETTSVEGTKLIIAATCKFLSDYDTDVFIISNKNIPFAITSERFSDIKQFIDRRFILSPAPAPAPADLACSVVESSETDKIFDVSYYAELPSPARPCSAAPYGDFSSMLDKKLQNLDESFSQMLLRKIDEKGITDAECYKKANIDRKLFSKIRNDVNYKPRKTTVIAFAVALELSLEDTEDMLKKAGYALSHSSKFDVIIEYFIENKIFNVFEINEALYAFDQNLLGA